MAGTVPTRYIIPLFTVVLLSLPASAQVVPNSAAQAADASAALRDLQAALLQGDAQAIAHRSAQRVDVTIFGASEVLSRSQALYVVRDFFRRYRPRHVSLLETSGQPGNWFASAAYSYENGREPLSIYVRMRANGGGWELRELQIGRSSPR